MVEKYIQISDFVDYILDNRELFLAQKLQDIKDLEGAKKVLTDYLIHFLLEIQDVINFDKTVALIIKNKVHFEVINELFE